MEKNRLAWIDWMKALLIMFVVIGHTNIESDGSILTPFIYLFHVPAFFFISGYLQSTQNRNGGANHSIKYLVIAILFWNFFFIILSNGGKLLLALAQSADVWSILKESFLSIIGIFLCWDNNYLPKITPFWFIWVLIMIKLIYSFINKFSWKFKTLIACLCIIYCIIVNLANKSLPFLWDRAIIALPYYIAGNIFRLKDGASKIFKLHTMFKLYFLVIGISLLLLTLIYSGTYDMFTMYQHTNGRSILWYYFMSLTGTFVLLIVCQYIKSNKYVTYISEGTLLILAIHLPIVKQLNRIGALDFDYTEISIGVLICIICIPLIIVSKKYLPYVLGRYPRV